MRKLTSPAWTLRTHAFGTLLRRLLCCDVIDSLPYTSSLHSSPVRFYTHAISSVDDSCKLRRGPSTLSAASQDDDPAFVAFAPWPVDRPSSASRMPQACGTVSKATPLLLRYYSGETCGPGRGSGIAGDCELAVSAVAASRSIASACDSSIVAEGSLRRDIVDELLYTIN